MRRSSEAPVVHSPASARQGRGAFTLLEMVLVLSVMVTVLMIAWPSLNQLRWEQQIKQGAEMIRLQMVSGRLHAMESGLAYQFRFEPGGKRFVVVPADYADIRNQSAAPNNASGPVSVRYWKTSGQFQAKVKFDLSAAGESDQRPQPLPEEFVSDFADGDELARVAWGAPLIFQPDGSARDFVLDVLDEEGRAVTLTVRGLTGGVTVSQLHRKAR